MFQVKISPHKNTGVESEQAEKSGFPSKHTIFRGLGTDTQQSEAGLRLEMRPEAQETAVRKKEPTKWQKQAAKAFTEILQSLSSYH